VFGGEDLAVSVPARELANVELPGSLYTADSLEAADVSLELRRALRQIEALSASSAKAPVFIARPELFTEGATLARLREKLGSVRDHLCLSDGSTIRPIPGMRNHVFFYGLGRRSHFDALARLESRVPELFSSLESQVNSALRITHGGRSYAPPTVVLHRHRDSGFVAPDIFRFYFNRHASEDSIGHVRSAVVPGGLTQRFAKLVYVPLTETAVADPHFMHLLSAKIERSYFDPTSCIILGLPHGPDKDSTLPARLQSLFSGLQAVPGRIPRLVADNVFIATEDIDPSQMRQLADGLELLLHETFDFWRWAPQSYRVFHRIGIVVPGGRRHHVAMLSQLLKLAYGRTAEIVRHQYTG
jgi:hypothetical protein